MFKFRYCLIYMETDFFKNKMMSKKNKLPMKDAFKVLTFIFGAILISACSQKITFPTSEVVPAAEATLNVEEKNDGNYEVELEVENIAKPQRLTPSRRNYVVWMVSKEHGTMNLGNLKVSDNNKASLSTVTPYEPIRVFITAEDKQDIIAPSTQVVLATDEFSVK